MRRRIPSKYRGKKSPNNTDKLLLGLRFLLSGLKIPAILIITGLLTVSIVYLFGGKTQAGPALIADNKHFEPVCRWCSVIEKDQSLYIALTEAGMTPRVVYDIDCGMKDLFDPRKIKPGDRVTVDLDSLGNLVSFELERSPWESYFVSKDAETDSFIGIKDTIPLTYILKAAKGEVEATLWQSMSDLDVPAEAILKFTDILSYDVDFLTETRPGQKFSIMYEVYLFKGEIIDVGRVMAAHYWLADTNYAGIFYMDKDSTQGYYNLAGKNTKKALLKTPLVYSRISSHFTHSRLHPILKIYRPHLGVDYAAPTGTPVSASGDGTVIYAGWKGGYGNFIEVSHTGGSIHTMYGHLSRFAGGIRKGVRVKQGQVIGYVGSTGLSTGPHLDYRVTVKGKHVNPLKYAFPDGPPVKKQYMAHFKETAGSYLQLLDMLSPNKEKIRAEI